MHLQYLNNIIANLLEYHTINYIVGLLPRGNVVSRNFKFDIKQVIYSKVNFILVTWSRSQQYWAENGKM